VVPSLVVLTGDICLIVVKDILIEHSVCLEAPFASLCRCMVGRQNHHGTAGLCQNRAFFERRIPDLEDDFRQTLGILGLKEDLFDLRIVSGLKIELTVVRHRPRQNYQK